MAHRTVAEHTSTLRSRFAEASILVCSMPTSSGGLWMFALFLVAHGHIRILAWLWDVAVGQTVKSAHG